MPRVLVVDDAAVVREKLKLILKKGAHEVVGEATNGLQAFLLYQKLLPDVVTMDITMPGMDGLMGIKKIKDKFPQAKIVVVSAMSQKSVIVEALENGADSFILKPFESEKVLKVVADVVATKSEEENSIGTRTMSSLQAEVLEPIQKAETDASLLKEMMAIKKVNAEKENALNRLGQNKE